MYGGPDHRERKDNAHHWGAREQPDLSHFCVLPQYRSVDQTSTSAALVHAECLDSVLVLSAAIVKVTAEKRRLYKDLASQSLARNFRAR
jgi:hypothetical protein